MLAPVASATAGNATAGIAERKRGGDRDVMRSEVLRRCGECAEFDIIRGRGPAPSADAKIARRRTANAAAEIAPPAISPWRARRACHTFAAATRLSRSRHAKAKRSPITSMHILEALDFHARFRPNDLAIIHEGGAA